MSTPVLRTRKRDRNQICSDGSASTVTDVLGRPCKWQKSFSGRGDASKCITNKFRRSAILQLNIEGLTASKMSAFSVIILLKNISQDPAHSLQCISFAKLLTSTVISTSIAELIDKE